MKFKNKVVVVTGGAKGIGEAIVKNFEDQGAKVIIISRHSANSNILNKTFDLSCLSKISKLIDEIVEENKQIDILVNNAGINANKSFWDVSIQELKESYAVNCIAPLLLSRSVGHIMKRQKNGVIINIGSIKGFEASSDPGYGSSKAALGNLTKTLAKELGASNIRVNMVVPGVVETDMISKMSYSKRRKYKDKTILRKFAKSSDIASAVSFLASSEASHITGAILFVDGGYNL